MTQGRLLCAVAVVCASIFSCTKNDVKREGNSATDSAFNTGEDANKDAGADGDTGVDTETLDTEDGSDTAVETETEDDCPPESCDMLDCDAAEGCEGNNIVLYIPYCVCGECRAPSEGVVMEECAWGCDDTVYPVCLPEPDGGESV